MQASGEQCTPTVIVQLISDTDKQTRRNSEGEQVDRFKMRKKKLRQPKTKPDQMP